ncbi:shadow of prion protein [Amia ocellicauda]|uniref:shadow of prion protein n=1 Tax=Amia ocellicauda TaxID=2972642 RepID=UPI0034645D15
MNRAMATCWMVILLSAFFCETVISKGGRGGARGAARGSARGARARFKTTRYGSSSLRVAGAAAAGAAAGVAAGGWYASSRYRSDDSSERDTSDNQYGNRTGDDYYSARRSASTQHCASVPTIATALSLISISMVKSF